MDKFIITGFPRSRTAWMAAFLSTGRTQCYHEGLFWQRSLSAKDNEGYDHVGNSDSGLACMPDLIPQGAKVVIIHRRRDEVERSLVNCGEFEDFTHVLDLSEDWMTCIDGAFHVAYVELDSEMEAICEFLGVPYDADRHREYMGKHIDPFKGIGSAN